MTAKLDVVIPVRDVDDYLGEALESALTQSGVDATVYVVDAGSARPIALPPTHADDDRVRLLRSDVGLLAGAARNLGASAGSSTWIAFLDADDLWPSDSRSALIDAAIAVDADLAVGTIEHFQDADSEGLRLPVDGQKALIPGGIVVRRTAWDAVGPFDPSLSVGEFIDWRNRARMASLREVFIDAPVLRRRIHVRSTMASKISDRSDYLEVVRRWMARSD